MHQTAKIGRYTIGPKSPVRVVGKVGTWHVVSITDRPGNEPAVEVVHTVNGRSRIFPLSSLIYVRPSSKRGTLAESHRDNTRVVAKALTPAKPIGRKAPRRKAVSG